MSIRTLGDRIAVELLPGAGKIGSIYIPDATKSTRNQTFCRAFVRSVGGGIKASNTVIPCGTVVVSEYFGDEVEVDGKKLRVGRVRDIVGVLGTEGIHPPDDRVLLERVDAPKMAGVIHLPEDRNLPHYWAKVVAVGPECVKDMRPGAEVLVQKHLAVEVRFEGREYLLADEPSLLAIR